MKSRAYTATEAIGKVVMKKGENRLRLIIDANTERCYVANMGWVSYEELMDQYILPDGSSCGVSN